MAPSEPLFATDRPGTSQSEESAAAAREDDALLGNQKGTTSNTRLWNRNAFWRDIGLFLWAVLATAAVIVLGVLYQHQLGHQHGPPKHTGKRNLIFMVSDGMGPASLSLTRSFRQFKDNLPIDDVLELDKHFIGSSRTRSSNSLVTDSAAGATAFSCGLKSYNGAISILPDHTPCGTILEAAKKAGYLTGLVVTTDLTDATPACFASHVNFRYEGDTIAQQEVGEHPLGRVVDIMLGGGRCHFLPNTTEGSCRADERDITKLAQEKYGWNYIQTRKEFDSLKQGKAVALPLLGLFANTDIPFEIDRRNMADVYPSLDEMAQVALTALEAATKNTDKGFFLMIEGSRIDHAGHGNDPAAQVHEVLAYDKAFSRVVNFIDNSNDQGMLIATSDHETGGLSVARQLQAAYPEYRWLPEALLNASHSAENLALKLNTYILEGGHDLKAYINDLVKHGLGIADPTSDELEALYRSPLLSVYYFADMVSKRAQIGWSTHGHSAVDVNIYAHPPRVSSQLYGNHENIEVGKYLQDYLGLNVAPITHELVKSLQTFKSASVGDAWTGRIPSTEEMEATFRSHGKERYGEAPSRV